MPRNARGSHVYKSPKKRGHVNQEAALRAAKREISKLRQVLGWAYQFAGAYNAPVKVLDILSDAANGDPLRHKFYPVDSPDWAKDAEIARLTNALRESVRLQSHYATLLNTHDGGKRMRFSAESWIARLAELERTTSGGQPNKPE
jgi:hypothetical protein